MKRISLFFSALIALVGCDSGTMMTGDTGTPGEDSSTGMCPAAGVTVSGEINSNTTWDCPLYVLTERVYVVDDAVLTINPGVTILGETGVSEAPALIVTRGAQLVAEGTAAEPIVFTSGNPEGARVTGDWAGVVLLGSATTNDGACIDDADTGTPACDAPGFLEDRIEGIEVGDDRGRYGGSDDASSCGSLEYVRIEYAGRELSPDNELNGLTIGGCGSGTNLSYIQVHRGKDDGIEFFGGTASIDHAVISGASDDGLDCDEGWRGNAQFIVVQQFAGIGDNAIECDSLGSDEDAEPRTNPTMSNFTLVGAGEGRVMVLREGFRGTLRNFVVTNFSSPPDLRAAEVDLNSEWPAMLSVENSFMYMVGDFPAETGEDDDDGGYDEEAAFTASERMNDFATDPMLTSMSATAPNYMPGVALAGTTPPAGGHQRDLCRRVRDGRYQLGRRLDRLPRKLILYPPCSTTRRAVTFRWPPVSSGLPRGLERTASSAHVGRCSRPGAPTRRARTPSNAGGQRGTQHDGRRRAQGRASHATHEACVASVGVLRLRGVEPGHVRRDDPELCSRPGDLAGLSGSNDDRGAGPPSLDSVADAPTLLGAALMTVGGGLGRTTERWGIAPRRSADRPRPRGTGGSRLPRHRRKPPSRGAGDQTPPSR